jgi:hypothetical protein
MEGAIFAFNRQITLVLTLEGYDTVQTRGYSLGSLNQLIETKEKENYYHPVSESRSNGNGDRRRRVGIFPERD